MQAIVAVDRNWAIGRGGGMLFHLPADLKYFAAATRGKLLVMGRSTLLSLPGSKPLKNRQNIILSRDQDCLVPQALVVHSLSELEAALAPYAPDEVMLIGGQQVYALLIDCCSKAFVTKIEAAAPADCYFPNLDVRPNWELQEQSPVYEDNGLHYTHCTYINHLALAITENRIGGKET